jgi:hypothetical protein
MVPANPLRMIAFFKQCQATNMAADILEKISKDKKQLKKRVRHMFLQHVALNRATSSTVATDIEITIKATNVIATIAYLIIIIKTINAMIVVNVTTRTRGTTSPTTRRMIASTITSRNRATRPRQ